MCCDKLSIILKRNTEHKLTYNGKIKTLCERIGSRVKLLQKP